jgi:hypothetical protein
MTSSGADAAGLQLVADDVDIVGAGVVHGDAGALATPPAFWPSMNSP